MVLGGDESVGVVALAGEVDIGELVLLVDAPSHFGLEVLGSSGFHCYLVVGNIYILFNIQYFNLHIFSNVEHLLYYLSSSWEKNFKKIRGEEEVEASEELPEEAAGEEPGEEGSEAEVDLTKDHPHTSSPMENSFINHKPSLLSNALMSVGSLNLTEASILKAKLKLAQSIKSSAPSMHSISVSSPLKE